MPSLTTIPITGLESNVVSQIQSGGNIPRITSITYPGNDTAADPAGGQTITINGTNFYANSTVYINGNVASVVGYVNANTLTFTAPASTPGILSLYVVNYDGGTAIAVPGLVYSGTPTWTTASGSLGAPYEANTFSVALQATGDAPITFALSAGNSLPSGITLAANGLLSGTIPATDPTTTYTFYVDAIDGQNQETARSFSVTYTKDAVTWSSPANGAAYSLIAGQSNTIALSATSAAGRSITYSVQSGTLPANVSISGSDITGIANAAQNNTAVVIRATAASTNRFADRTLYFTVTAITNMIRKFSANALFRTVGVDSSENIYLIGNDGNNGLIAKFNSTGVCQFIRRVSGYTPTYFYNGTVAANGQFLAYGYVNYGSQYGFVAKFDANGDKLWENGFGRPSMIYSAFFDPDGSGTTWVVGGGQGDTGQDHHLIKIYANGAYQSAWNSTDSRSNSISDIFIDANFIYIAGYQEYTNYGNEQNGYIAKLSKSNPTSVSWSKSISRNLGVLTDESVQAITVDASGDIYGLMYGMKQGQGLYEPSIFKLYANGSSFAWIRKMTDLNSQSSYQGKDGNITLSNNNIIVNFKEGSYKQIVLKYNTSGTIQWQREFNVGSPGDANNAIGETPHRSAVYGDYFYMPISQYNFVYGRTDFSYLAKFNLDGSGANTYDSRLVYANYTGSTEAERTEYSLYNNGVGFGAFTPGVMNGTSLTVSANNPSGAYTITNVLG